MSVTRWARELLLGLGVRGSGSGCGCGMPRPPAGHSRFPGFIRRC